MLAGPFVEYLMHDLAITVNTERLWASVDVSVHHTFTALEVIGRRALQMH